MYINVTKKIYVRQLMDTLATGECVQNAHPYNKRKKLNRSDLQSIGVSLFGMNQLCCTGGVRCSC